MNVLAYLIIALNVFALFAGPFMIGKPKEGDYTAGWFLVQLLIGLATISVAVHSLT